MSKDFDKTGSGNESSILSLGSQTGKSNLILQRKLSIGAVNDPMEHEADAMADKVMRMPEPNFIQRKCSHCEEEEKAQLKPLTSFIQKKGVVNNNTADDFVSSQIHSTKGNGISMPETTKNFMESRFGADFSNVNIHTGDNASQLSNQLNARAFTVGNDIYFNDNAYKPENESGKHLLAHELTHVVQQKGANSGANKISKLRGGNPDAKKIQRAVSPNFSSIKKKLSTNFLDWAVTDEEAHQVLVWLKQLSPNDLRDTIAAMENNHLVGTFFDNLTTNDMTTESEFLQTVQNYRTHSATQQNGNTAVTVSSTFSCTLEQGNELYQSMTTAQRWLDTAIARLRGYSNAPGAPGMADVAGALQTHVHTTLPAHIQLLINRLQDFRNQMFSGNNLEVECAAPSDGLCRALAAAYVLPETPKKMRFCPTFFSSDKNWRIEATIHEAMHAFFSNNSTSTDPNKTKVTDRGYAHERVYEFLSPEEAFDNSDSIAMLVQVLALGKASAQSEMSHLQDDFSDCNNDQKEILRPIIARAARWNLNAINILGDTRADFRAGYAYLRSRYFRTDHVDRIPTLLETYQDSKSKFDDNLSIECETDGGACSSGTTGYYRSFIFKSGTLHVCPVLFTMGDEAGIKSFLSLAIMNSAGKSNEDSIKYADFAKALTDKYWGEAAQFPNP